MNNYISLIGLGAVGGPLADLLFRKYNENFILLSSEKFIHTLNNVYINGLSFCPTIVYKKDQLKKKLSVVFICVKNYQLGDVKDLLSSLVDDDTIIVPLQNGVYSFDFFKTHFPNNVILEGFAQGPNTTIINNIYTYQKPGVFHIGSSQEDWKNKAKFVFELMKKANIDVFYDENINYSIWKKMMLNVAGNAVTALTGIDYCQFAKSQECQKLCIEAMKEFSLVSRVCGVEFTQKDIDEIISYFLSFKVSKKTSMLEDVINCRPTENDFLAGYIVKIANKHNILVPHIQTLYFLMKIKENVYLNTI